MITEKIIFSGENKRLDIFLKEKYPEISREFIKKIIKNGSVKLNNKIPKPSEILREKDIIEINFSESQKMKLTLKDIIVYQDDYILIINKPTGILTHPTDSNWLKIPQILEISQDSIASILYRDLFKYYGKNPERMGIVHRLDRETSGIMIIAKDENTYNNLQEQFSKRQISKTYIGVVIGKIPKNNLIINAPIGREVGDKKMKVWEYGREAITEIKVIKSNDKYSYLEIYPKTGRTNQIRVHLLYIGNPILGDKIYSKIQFDRLMLHSYKIKFIHPKTNKIMEFKAEPDSQFKKLLKNILNI